MLGNVCHSCPILFINKALSDLTEPLANRLSSSEKLDVTALTVKGCTRQEYIASRSPLNFAPLGE